MSGHKSTGEDKLMEAYYKLIGEAHIENIVEELAEHKEEINNTIVPKSLDEWFDTFQKSNKEISDRKRRIKGLRKLSSRAAVFVIIVITSMTVVTLSVDAFRIRVFNLFQERNDSFTEIYFTEDQGNQEKPTIDLANYYYLSYLPTGYHYEQYSVIGDGITIEYSNDQDVLTFDQDKSGASYQLDTENSEVHDIVIGENSGQLIVKKERVMLFWTDENNSFLIIGLLPEQEIIKMANSLEKNK